MALTVHGTYVAKKIDELSDGKTLHILDMGCGKGNVIEGLLPKGHAMYGYDFENRRTAASERLRPYYQENFDNYIKFVDDERKIPFADQQFDLIYAIQVFEHVRFLDSMLAECARVLKPSGKLIMTFPLATAPIEQHVNIPFVQWLPPGNFRVRYLHLWYWLRLRPRLNKMSPYEMAVSRDNFLRNQTYYRFLNEYLSVGAYFFSRFEIDTQTTLRTKLALVADQGVPWKRSLAQWLLNMDDRSFNTLASMVSHFVNITLIFCDPQ
ncbi:MAG: class I SAM-dependent methyltransferase [Anaerolineae bacterium]|nr:class I SAM-dependent methyltransferase [Anaerolineae bacterium]